MFVRVKPFLSAVILVMATAASSGTAGAQNARITMLHINDVYEIAPVGGKGGFAQLMTLLKRERAANPNSITTVGGDFLSPSLLSGLTGGAQMVRLFNALEVDYVGFGNHEFDFAPAVTRQRISESNFRWIGTNVMEADGKPFGNALRTAIRKVGDVKVGYLGLLTEDTMQLANPGPEVRLTPPLDTAAKAVAELRADGAHVVVALTHMTIAEDRELARRVKGIDVILGGHDHDPITVYESGVLIHKSGYDAHYLGALDIEVTTRDTATGPVTMVTPAGWRMVATAGATPDPEIEALVKDYDDRLDTELGAVVGRTMADLDSRRETVRTAEAGMGNLIADALREGLAADAALINGGGIRGDVLRPAGTDLTRRDILAELPFGNVAVLVAVQGSDLKAALENGLSRIEDKAGRFPQVSGMTVTYDPKAPAGSRVVEARVGGRPLDPDAVYRVATHDYLLGGGDGYGVLAQGRPIVDASGAVLVATMVMDYVAARKAVTPAVEGRIRAVD